MTDTSRRNLLTGAVAVATVGTLAACTDKSTGKTGGSVTQDAGNVNDLQTQEERLTIAPFNAIKRDPAQAYPAALLKHSLEMQNLRERLLRFNDASKLGWAYMFTVTGNLVAVLPVAGKVSSTQSSMTTSTGIYMDQGAGGGGNVPVPLPSDDLSFGPNEGGDSGKFFFTPDGVYVFWDGPILYLDAPLDILAQPVALKYNEGSKPSSVAPKA